MHIKITSYKPNSYRADLTDLPGSPSVGLGKTTEIAIASLLYNLLITGDIKSRSEIDLSNFKVSEVLEYEPLPKQDKTYFIDWPEDGVTVIPLLADTDLVTRYAELMEMNKTSIRVYESEEAILEGISEIMYWNRCGFKFCRYVEREEMETKILLTYI